MNFSRFFAGFVAALTAIVAVLSIHPAVSAASVPATKNSHPGS